MTFIQAGPILKLTRKSDGTGRSPSIPSNIYDDAKEVAKEALAESKKKGDPNQEKLF